MSLVRILVVDDVPSWRKFVKFVLAGEPIFKVLAEAANGQKAIEMALKLNPAVVLMDVGLPNVSGIEVARQIRLWAPEVKVIFLSEHNDPQVVAAAMHTGASGYVLKYEATRDLVPSIHAALRNKTFVSRGLRPPTSSC
jgi:two-component system, NarL family, nitrate/nitrite response regulator NarL